MVLISYGKHHNDSFKAYSDMQEEGKNKKSNVACPKCGSVLMYDETIVLTSIPPLHHPWCSNGMCKFKGYI